MPFRLRAVMASLVGALALMIGVTATAAAGTASEAGSDRAPRARDVSRLLDVPFADPGYFTERQVRYIYATGHDPETGRAFRVSAYDKSTGRYGVPRPSMVVRPRWVGPRGSRHSHGEVHMWGPHVWKRAVRGPLDYVMYFSASRRGGSDCIGMAVAASPLGPFEPQRRPLRCADPGATLIDPAYFRTRSGVHYLLYKRHRYRPKQVAIWAVRVRPNGESRRGARPFRVIDGGKLQIEAPSVVSRKGRVYIFASRRAYDSCDYRTVAYVGASLKRAFRPLGRLGLRRPNGRRFCGPGGAEVRNVRGTFRIVFHAFDRNPVTTPGPVARFAWGGPLRWTSKGRPYPAPFRPRARFVVTPRATVRSSANSGSSSFSP